MKQNILIILLFVSIFNKAALSQPTTKDYLLGYGGLALFGTSEIIKEYLTPSQPNWTKTNDFDLYFREHLKWQNKHLKTAKLLSDIIAKGLFIPSIFVTPLLTDNNYSYQLLVNIQTIAVTGLIVNTTKFVIARQRPYSAFNTFPSNGADDYLSFFSGHTSFPFAITTSTAYMLQKEIPHQSGVIWTSGILLASLSGYLRIAADHHYLTDVLTGMVVGSTVGYIISKNQTTSYLKSGAKIKFLMFSVSF